VSQQYNWNPEETLKALELQRDVESEGDVLDDYITLAKKNLRSAVLGAVDSIRWLSMYSENESVRLRASQYLVDQVIGKSSDAPLSGVAGSDSLGDLVRGVVRSN
jgi:hypothetical protein